MNKTKEHMQMYYVGEESANGEQLKEMRKQNSPPNATVVNFGVSFFHLNVTAKIAKPRDDKRPHNNPNRSLKSVLL